MNPKTEINKNLLTTNWYVIRTRHNCESKLVEMLEKAGVKAEAPMYTTIRQWSDRKKKCTVPLLNSVVFVNTTEKGLNDLYQFNHVNGILKDLGKPAVVRDEEMETLRCIAREWSGEKVTELESGEQFEPGDTVKILRGPFKGVIGELIDLKGKHKVRVILKALDVQFAIAISKAQVQKLAAEKK